MGISPVFNDTASPPLLFAHEFRGLEELETTEGGDVIHLEATPQPPPGVAARKVEARAKLPYVEEGP